MVLQKTTKLIKREMKTIRKKYFFTIITNLVYSDTHNDIDIFSKLEKIHF